MSHLLTAVYHHEDNLEEAVIRLEQEAQIPKSALKIVFSDSGTQEQAHLTNQSRGPEGAALGAVVGAVLGFGLAGLTIVTGLGLPRLGMVDTGSTVSVFVGGLSGLGGVIGGLIGLRRLPYKSRVAGRGLHHGDAVLTVDTPDDKVGLVRQVLETSENAVSVTDLEIGSGPRI